MATDDKRKKGAIGFGKRKYFGKTFYGRVIVVVIGEASDGVVCGYAFVDIYFVEECFGFGV
jgi:hypothetical protein